MSTTWTYIREQYFGNPFDIHVPLAGKTVLVTGSNQGLGYHAALQLARMNPAVLILAVRDTTKGDEAATSIRTAAAAFEGQLLVWQLDLASFDSVKAFSRRCHDELERLDVAIMNAGVTALKWTTTKDGWESQLQVNALATGLLSVLLLPLLSKTGQRFPDSHPHLTLVGSEVHMWAAVKESKVGGSLLAALNSKEHFNMSDRYNVTKLLDLFMTRKIAALPAAHGVTVNVVNPGLCRTNFRHELPVIVQWLIDTLMMARPTDVGAKNLVWAALSPTAPGAYVSVCRVSEPSPFSTSVEGIEMQNALWDDMVKEWVKLAPEVERVVSSTA